MTKKIFRSFMLSAVAVLLAGVLTVAIFGMYGEGYVEKPFIYFQF